MIMDEKWRSFGAQAIWGSLGIAVLVAAWMAASGTLVNPYYLGDPRLVLEQIVSWIETGTLYRHVAATVSATVLGFAVAAPLAIALALLLGSNRGVSGVMHPYILAAFAIPKIILAPLVMIWVGVGFAPALVLAALTAFFLIFFNAYDGIRSAPATLINVMRILGASPATIAVKVRLPAAMPQVALGLRLGLIYAFHGAVAGEMTASNKGLGYLIIFSATKMEVNSVLAGLVVLGVFALMLVALLDLAAGLLPGSAARATTVS